jgi:hypothetical protein
MNPFKTLKNKPLFRKCSHCKTKIPKHLILNTSWGFLCKSCFINLQIRKEE